MARAAPSRTWWLLPASPSEVRTKPLPCPIVEPLRSIAIIMSTESVLGSAVLDSTNCGLVGTLAGELLFAFSIHRAATKIAEIKRKADNARRAFRRRPSLGSRNRVCPQPRQKTALSGFEVP